MATLHEFTLGVVTLGLLPPIAPGRMDPVSLYRASILETQPWLTLKWREHQLISINREGGREGGREEM